MVSLTKIRNKYTFNEEDVNNIPYVNHLEETYRLLLWKEVKSLNQHRAYHINIDKNVIVDSKC